MGFFDKLFKKKKSVAAKPKAIQNRGGVSTTTVQSAQVIGSQRQVPIKGPPGSKREVYGPTPTTTHAPAKYRESVRAKLQQSELDSSAQRLIEESVSKIDQPIPPSVQRELTGAKPKIRKVKRRAKVAGQRAVVKRPVATAGTLEPTTEMVRPPVPKTEPVSDQELMEDTLGEEELFKKLAKWDKDLKQRVATKKVRPATGTDKPKVAAAKQSIGEAQLDQREKELKELEAKLLEKEKKLKQMEEMNKMFSQIQDTELEQISGELGGAGTIGGVVPVGEGGVQVAGQVSVGPEVQPPAKVPGAEVPESEELLEPIKNLTFTNFIVGPSNRFAHDVSLSVAKAPAEAYNPLFIYSQVGLGKTHLLCAIGNYIKSKDPSARIVYASSEKFTNELLDYLRLGEMEKFRIKYRNVDVLLIDDIQFIGGQEGTQEEFFHTFNALYNAHKQIVITSDRPPKNIAHLKDRLRSRFEGGLIVNIKPPDLGTRTMILHEKAERDGIYIPDEIINYVAGKVKSNVRTLIGVLNRVVAHSSLTDRELDTGLVDEVLHDVLDQTIEFPQT